MYNLSWDKSSKLLIKTENDIVVIKKLIKKLNKKVTLINDITLWTEM